ncbi:MAG: glycoside hydrolase family 32 protein [Acidobacteriaceae bacterium]|nr:glycoside hydrolase family 32 protein [Acidobacteriaceae bacterium]
MLIWPLLLVFIALWAQNATPPAYNQPYRPQFHFSPREYWTNDPNGVVHFEGEYHLFFQYNPLGDQWGHMSWGHAVSRDLVHWQQLPVALAEKNGVMIFTGSTVIDEHNTSGFCTGGKPCMVAIYTGHTPESGARPALQTQNIAYSNDRGRTWKKYSGNPVLNLNMSDFRDPKVFWSQQSRRWVMGVSLPNDHKVRFYGSADLKRWTQISEFGPAGATDGQWECPELFELPIEGGGGATRWVLKVGLNPGALQGGSGEQYFVGQFDGTKFQNDNPASLQLWTDYGKDCYCALTFNGLPRNQRAVMIGWMDNWQYAAQLPTSPWRGQMTFPRSLSLRKTAEGLRLVQEPYEGLKRLKGPQSGTGLAAASFGDAQSFGNTDMLQTHTFLLHSEMKTGDAQQIGWRLLADSSHYTLVGYDTQRHKLFVDRTHSGLTSFSKDFPATIEAPLVLQGDTLSLDILVDRCSVEVFADGGQVTSTNLVFPPEGANGLETLAKGGRGGRISASMTEIRSIWE